MANVQAGETCRSWFEWWNTGGMGETCTLPHAHADEHKGKTSTWRRLPEEKRLVATIIANRNEVRVLREALEKIRDLPITDPLASAYDIACEALTSPTNTARTEE